MFQVITLTCSWQSTDCWVLSGMIVCCKWDVRFLQWSWFDGREMRRNRRATSRWNRNRSELRITHVFWNASFLKIFRFRSHRHQSGHHPWIRVLSLKKNCRCEFQLMCTIAVSQTRRYLHSSIISDFIWRHPTNVSLMDSASFLQSMVSSFWLDQTGWIHWLLEKADPVRSISDFPEQSSPAS